MNEWKETTLGVIPIDWNIVNFIDSVDIKNGQVNPTKTPYLDMLHIGSENIEQNSGRLINIKTNRQKNISSGNYYFTGDDILYSKIRPYFNKVALPHHEGTCSADVYPLRSKNEYFDKKFLFYFLLSDLFLTQAISFQDRTGIPKINREQLGVTLLLNPSLPEQKRIANILSCLDTKIDNLRQQNETLEEIARSIFKHWFIDFEFPNADGKPYKSSGGAMVRSDLGDIPEGWRVRTLGDVATNNSETHKFEDKNKIIFINTGDVLDGKFLHENYMSVNTLPGQAKKRIAKDDILYSEIRPKNKHFAYINFERNLENYVVSTKFMVVRANDSILPRLLYLILKRQESIDEFNYIAESRSGTFPQITFEAVSHFQFPLPPIDIQQYLMPVFTNLMEKKEFNIIKIETLTKTRDALLPKLMSGQIRVSD
jgi:type I restriction enzyme, S subunit